MAAVNYAQWVRDSRSELSKDLLQKDLTRHQLVQEIPDTWYCHVPIDLSRELPLCGSWTYAAPEINLMIAEILTGDQDLVQQMFHIIEGVDELELISDMEDFVTENQIEECLDYIENVEEDIDPEIEFALLQFEEDFDELEEEGDWDEDLEGLEEEDDEDEEPAAKRQKTD